MSTPTPAETKRLSAYLAEPEPLERLFQESIPIVFRDDPRRAVPARLGTAARNVYLVSVLSGEVLNGGISQFFSNSSGDFVPETLEALGAIGAQLSTSLLEQALAAFSGALPPRDRLKRCEVLFAFESREPNALQRIDAVFYDDVFSREAKEHLERLQLAYVHAHADEPLVAVASAC